MNSRHIVKLLAIILPVFFIGYFLESFRHVSSILGDYFEITTQLLPLVLSFSIFVITWYAYSKSKDNHSLFLGAVFLIAGLFDLFHMLSYPFMPAFITPNSAQKSAIFLSESMLVSALLLLGSAYVYKTTFPGFIKKSFLFAFIIVLSFISLTTEFFYPDYLPVMSFADGSFSSGMIFVQLATAAILMCTAYLYARRLREAGEKNIICLIYSFIIIAFSDLVVISDGYAGHLLKAAGLYFVYLALYRTSVEEPFEKLTEAETKLRHAAEERYRNLFENANDAIITTELDGAVTTWNRSAEKIFGWGADEAAGNKISQLMVPHDLLAMNEQIIQKVMLGEDVSSIETVFRRRDGSGINVSLTVSPLRDTDQHIVGMSYIVRDITDRKRAEEMRLENIRLENERLMYASKAKSEFLAIMSHELRTPLNSIIGFSELLKRRASLEPGGKHDKYVDNIILSGKHLLNLINDILDLTKIEVGKMDILIEEVNVPQAIEETINLVKVTAERRNVIINRDLAPQLNTIEADKKRFRQILFNLLSNAVKFSKEGGGIVTIKAIMAGNIAEFSVSDTGIGIREKDLEKAFLVFQQLDSGISRKYGGTGLGLSITKQLVEMHGGKIWAESKYGEGSTFTFSLPLKAKRMENQK
ncbi:MAG: PAS domain S-box protein [Candidatus Methanoperedens sp.]|nr:PAS domain S-box protein [Candidatus Methanoperedens sp.]